MLESLCILFMTGYFKYADGSYSPVPEDSIRIEIKTENFRTLLFKINYEKWFGIVNGKIFLSSLDSYTKLVCNMADKERLPEIAYKERSVLSGN